MLRVIPTFTVPGNRSLTPFGWYQIVWACLVRQARVWTTGHGPPPRGNFPWLGHGNPCCTNITLPCKTCHDDLYWSIIVNGVGYYWLVALTSAKYCNHISRES